jgi:lysophospholipase L1-like esterase
MRRRRSLLLLALVALACYLGCESLRVWQRLRRAGALGPVATGRHRLGRGAELHLWVMGDSLGAGYGASDFSASLVGVVARGLVADGHEVVVDDVAAAGATMADVLAQPLPPSPADVILVTAGSNDLLRLRGAGALRRDSAAAVARLAPHGERVVIAGPGVIADATAIPFALRPLYRWLRPSYVAAMRAATAGGAAVHVDPAAGAEALGDYRATVSDVDGFHLSDAGHRWWGERILAALAGR